MEALGVAASLIAVIELTGACLKLSRKWIGSSNFSSSELNMTVTDLYAFNGVIRSFQTHLEICEDDHARLLGLDYLLPVVERCNEALEAIKDYLERSGFIEKHVLAPRFDRKLKLSLRVIGRAKELFMLAVQADQQTIISGVDRYIRNVSEDIQELHAVVSETKSGLEKFGELGRTHFQRADTWMSQQDAQRRQDERQSILDWITDLDYTPQYNDFLDRRQVGTGKWLLDSERYATWVAAENPTLFCRGIPGSGKTILTATVIEDLNQRFAADQSVSVAYIYFNFRRQFEHQPRELLGCLLKQLASQQPAIPFALQALYEKHQGNRTKPDIHEIMDTLTSVARIYSRVFLVVDALDECRSDARCRNNFLENLATLQEKTNTSCFLTSRSIPEIEDLYSSCPSLEIVASNEDLSIYIDGHMDQLPAFVSSKPELRDQIKIEVISAADGMFLVAQLYLASLEDKTTVKAVRTALLDFNKRGDCVPGGDAKLAVLSKAYEEAMERIQGQRAGFRRLAEKVLAWIVCTHRPLETPDLLHALAIERGERKIDEENVPHIDQVVSVCSGLVTVDRASNVVRLIHFTAQEYFKRTKDRWFPAADEDITTACVTYMSFDAFSSGFCDSYAAYKMRLERHPLYSYAVRNWDTHARSAQCNPAVLDFLQRQSNVEAALQVLSADPFDRQRVATSIVPRKGTGLHLAARLQLDSALESLLSKGCDPNAVDSLGRTPLAYAVHQGRKSTTRILLERGDVRADTQDSDGATPLMYAVRRGYLVIVDMFLQLPGTQIDVNRRDANGSTALLWAAHRKRKDVVLRLLDDGRADASVRDSFGQSALAFAAEAGDTLVVKRLLAIDEVDPNAQDMCGFTPLFLAECKGSREVADLLRAAVKGQYPAFRIPSQPFLRRKILAEVRGLNFDLPGNILPVQCVDFDLLHWKGAIYGPDNTPYEDGIFHLDIEYPLNYPFSPMKVRFTTKILHPNINNSGLIGIDILQENWSPIFSLPLGW